MEPIRGEVQKRLVWQFDKFQKKKIIKLALKILSTVLLSEWSSILEQNIFFTNFGTSFCGFFGEGNSLPYYRIDYDRFI